MSLLKIRFTHATLYWEEKTFHKGADRTVETEKTSSETEKLDILSVLVQTSCKFQKQTLNSD